MLFRSVSFSKEIKESEFEKLTAFEDFMDYLVFLLDDVNYYDRNEKLSDENPTIGILLCADKNNALVKYSLPENNKTIMASKYQLYLPSEQQLLDELNQYH